jgi:hypothetical protein
VRTGSHQGIYEIPHAISYSVVSPRIGPLPHGSTRGWPVKSNLKARHGQSTGGQTADRGAPIRMQHAGSKWHSAHRPSRISPTGQPRMVTHRTQVQGGCARWSCCVDVRRCTSDARVMYRGQYRWPGACGPPDGPRSSAWARPRRGPGLWPTPIPRRPSRSAHPVAPAALLTHRSHQAHPAQMPQPKWSTWPFSVRLMINMNYLRAICSTD